MSVNNHIEDESTVMRDAFNQLDPSATKFIFQEFALSQECFLAMSEDDLDDLYDQLCDIEHEETPSDNSPLTERGSMVEYIVTIVGNYFSEKLGYTDDDPIDSTDKIYAATALFDILPGDIDLETAKTERILEEETE